MKKATRTTKMSASKIAIAVSFLLVVLLVGTMTVFAAENVTYVQAFPDANFRWVVLQIVGNNKLDESVITDEDIQIISAQETLNVSSRNIVDLTGIEYFKGIIFLDCSLNKLTTLDLSNNTLLEKLDCTQNKITSLDFSNNEVFEELIANYNSLTSLNLSHCPLFRSLACRYNNLTELDLSHNPKIYELFCVSNKIVELDLLNHPELMNIDCSYNPLKSLELSGVRELLWLLCGATELESLDLSNNPKLVYLACYSSELTELDLSHNPDLSTVACHGNRLTTLDVSANPLLKEIDCQSNMLTGLDLSHLTEFYRLICYDNYMESPDSVIGWYELGLVLNSLEDPDSGLYLFYPQKNTSLFNISVSSVVARPGDFVTVEVSASRNPGIMAFALNSMFDSSVFDFNAYNAIRIGGDVVQGLSDSGVARLVWVGTEVIDFDGGLYTLTFRVADDAPIGTYPITIGGQVAGGDAEKLKVNFKNGTITIRGLIYGDLNEDEIVDISDIVLLRKYLLGDIQLSDLQIRAADVNSDGDVDASDLLLVMRYIAGGYNVVLGG